MKIPLATYRLQFSPAFGFGEAARILDYLVRLGISDMYSSPIFRPRRGSTHGYDVVDMNALNTALGTEEEFQNLTYEASVRGLGWIQDIVPNHMAFDRENAMLMDVLENGPNSVFVRYFDIDWEHPYKSLRGRLLAPFLGDLFGDVLDRGEVSLQYCMDGFRIEYGDISLPLSIESYTALLTFGMDRLREELSEDSPSLIKFLGILYTLRGLDEVPGGEGRRTRVNFIKRVLWELYSISGEIRGHVEEVVKACNAEGNSSFLEEILSKQWFRLSFWKVATEEINYRRFFNINGLISLRMENDEVFRDSHVFVWKLMEEGKITGLRIDHIDGLADPGQYLEKLRREVGDAYVVVEKILGKGEVISGAWPVQGTTGYDFLNSLNALFCDMKNRRSFNRIYRGFTGSRDSFADMVYEKKKLILVKHMSGDVDNLALLLEGVSSRDRYGIDMTRQGLRRALVEIMSCYPVYRTYISSSAVSEDDRRTVKAAVSAARARNPGLTHEISFVQRFLLLEGREGKDGAEEREADAFVKRFQQFTGPLMAKGYEDTVLYVYNRLLSLNEVGGSPDSFGVSPGDFHSFVRRRLKVTPHTMNATGTHDSKRGEDARARINVLSEMPKQWEEALKRWNRFNKHLKNISHGREMPDRNDEYMLYQAMVGSFPFFEEEIPDFRERLRDYAVKAVREAKVHTAWLKPDSEYEEIFLSFIDGALSCRESNQFLEDFLDFHRRTSRLGVGNSLSQTIIKITAPGVPDFYQGSELWDFSFVDPDNRRIVDFDLRVRLMEKLRGKEGDLPGLARHLCGSYQDGRIKLFLIRRVLAARKEREKVFREGEYLPLKVAGSLSRHVLSFARRSGSRWAVTVASRFPASLEGKRKMLREESAWGDTIIQMPKAAPGRWRNAITDLPVKGGCFLGVENILSDFPVSLLLSE